MDYREILNITRNLIDEIDEDEQIDVIIKSGIQQGYRELCKVDKRPSITYIPIIRRIATLPDDFDSFIECKPELGEGDRKVGNAIITDKEGTLEVMYNTSRPPLIKDSDIPDLAEELHYGIVLYACFMYFQHRKKGDVASSFFSQFDRMKFEFENKHTIYINEEVRYVE